MGRPHGDCPSPCTSHAGDPVHGETWALAPDGCQLHESPCYGTTCYHFGVDTSWSHWSRKGSQTCPSCRGPAARWHPPNHLYVGRGHHSHRLARTKWASPWTPGHDCSEDEWIYWYVEHILNTDLCHQLPNLADQTLVCDCAWQDVCESDLLAGLVFDACSPPSPGRVQQAGGPAGPARLIRSVILAAGSTSGQAQVPAAFPAAWRQEAVVLAFKKLFPAPWFESFSFPMIEDILNQPPFTAYSQWLYEADLDWDIPLVPHLAQASTRLKQRHSDRQQAGAHSHRAALPPLLSYGLDPDDHFYQTRVRAQQPLPTEQLPVLDMDLRFAASLHAHHRGRLRSLRDSALGALRELKRRWTSVTKHLRQFQPPSIQAVTSKRDLGLVSLLVVLTSWADTGYPYGLIQGLPAVGYAPHYGVFPRLEVSPITFQDSLGDWKHHNAHILRQLRPSKDDTFLLQQSVADAENSFCTFPMSMSEFQTAYKGAPHRLIPRCVITQSSGKQRVIDNADTGGQSATSRESNKLLLCSPFRPAQQIALTLSFMSAEERHLASREDTWQSGGEDWPDAYRHSPMHPDEALGCVVVFWHEGWGAPALQVYTGLLFGLPLAVTSFNRYSRLAESLGRRLTYSLVSMYFDDASIVDWSSSKGSSQAAFSSLNKMLGTPFATDKQQLMSSRGTFLGLEHDLSSAMSTGQVTFWVRDRLQEKLLDLINTAQQSAKLTPGVASKIYGLANFFEMGVYGRVGCGGLAAIKQRQDEKSHSLSPALLQCFDVLRAVIHSKPTREFEVFPQPHLRFCVASDAALEVPKAGTGGFLIVWFSTCEEIREGFVADIPEAIYDLWSPGPHKIAQLELMMVLYALVTRASSFRNRRGVWMVDNIAALMTLIKGRSESEDLERMAHMVHTILYALRCWMWWEYIPSKSNWADAISRLGRDDPWHRRNHFTTNSAVFPFILWHLPFTALVSVFEYLWMLWVECVGPGVTRADQSTNPGGDTWVAGGTGSGSHGSQSIPKHIL